jgi:hypothetical protein
VEYPPPGDHDNLYAVLGAMKITVTNHSNQHAQIWYWRATKGDVRLDHFNAPMHGESSEFDAPDDQMEHIAKQCRVLRLSVREGTK